MLDIRGNRVEDVLELSAADDAEVDVGCRSRGVQDRLDALQRNQLADEENHEQLAALPARLEQPLFCADVADRHFIERR